MSSKIFEPEITDGDWESEDDHVYSKHDDGTVSDVAWCYNEVQINQNGINDAKAISAIPEMLAVIKAVRRLKREHPSFFSNNDDRLSYPHMYLDSALHRLDEKHGVEK